MEMELKIRWGKEIGNLEREMWKKGEDDLYVLDCTVCR